MPIYEYKCDRCDHQLEILQKISDGPAKTCPECGADSLRKLVSAAAFKLKGTGWYETDFKDKKPKQGAKNAKVSKTDSKEPPGSDQKKPDSDKKYSSTSNKTKSSTSSPVSE